MEITLIPIAAILLLFAGFSSPAPHAVEDIPSAAVLRFWLSRDRARATCRPMLRPVRRASVDCVPSLGQTATRVLQNRVTGHAASTVHLLGRKLFRTRFGVATGAYRPTAPPPAV